LPAAGSAHFPESAGKGRPWPSSIPAGPGRGIPALASSPIITPATIAIYYYKDNKTVGPSSGCLAQRSDALAPALRSATQDAALQARGILDHLFLLAFFTNSSAIT
jgi:hypothetical protein